MTEGTSTSPGVSGSPPRTLIAFLHATLDGFIATSDGTFWKRFPWGEQEMAWNNEQFREADTWVLGRTMYEAIVPWWTAVAMGPTPEDAGEVSPADQEFAQLLIRMTKVVVSTTLDASEDRQVIANDVPRRLEELKRRPGATVMLSCGPTLLTELAQHAGLIDEYLIIVHPTAIGVGVPLFARLAQEVQLNVAEVKPFQGGTVALRYRPLAL